MFDLYENEKKINDSIRRDNNEPNIEKKFSPSQYSNLLKNMIIFNTNVTDFENMLNFILDYYKDKTDSEYYNNISMLFEEWKKEKNDMITYTLHNNNINLDNVKPNDIESSKFDTIKYLDLIENMVENIDLVKFNADLEKMNDIQLEIIDIYQKMK